MMAKISQRVIQKCPNLTKKTHRINRNARFRHVWLNIFFFQFIRMIKIIQMSINGQGRRSQQLSEQRQLTLEECKSLDLSLKLKTIILDIINDVIPIKEIYSQDCKNIPDESLNVSTSDKSSRLQDKIQNGLMILTNLEQYIRLATKFFSQNYKFMRKMLGLIKQLEEERTNSLHHWIKARRDQQIQYSAFSSSQGQKYSRSIQSKQISDQLLESIRALLSKTESNLKQSSQKYSIRQHYPHYNQGISKTIDCDDNNWKQQIELKVSFLEKNVSQIQQKTQSILKVHLLSVGNVSEVNAQNQQYSSFVNPPQEEYADYYAEAESQYHLQTFKLS